MNTPPSDIRRAGPDDARIVAEMVGEIAAHQNQSESVAISTEQWRDVLGRDDVVVLIAERAGQAAGYVSAIRRLHLWSGADILALDDLYVREQARDGGVGRALMIELARFALPDRLTITWGMQVDNHGAQRFYARLGARLNQKVMAAWDPDVYARSLAD